MPYFFVGTEADTRMLSNLFEGNFIQLLLPNHHPIKAESSAIAGNF